jgi:hypothetical protein
VIHIASSLTRARSGTGDDKPKAGDNGESGGEQAGSTSTRCG